MALQGCTSGSGSARLLPAEILAWEAREPDGLYDATTLFDYIDGGAEIYRALNVREVRARTYAKKGAPEIVVDLFDMGSSSDAFGAYHHDLREGAPAGIGRESESEEGGLAFWKGRWFVSITSADAGGEAGPAILELGRRIAGAIPDEGEPPALRRWLPEDRLLSDQIRYFHTEALLNVYYRLAEGNPLGLHGGTEGIVARYTPAGAGAPEGSYVILLVRYGSEGEASNALRRLRDGYLPEADTEGIARSIQGRWHGARALGTTLIAVLGAPSREEVERSMEEARSRKQQG